MPEESAASEEAPVSSSIYTCEGLSRELRQGEVLSNVIQYSYDFVEDEASSLVLPFAVVLSQDCDLLQDFNRTQSGNATGLNGVLLVEAGLSSSTRHNVGNSGLWKRARQNNDERWHVLQRIDPSCDAENVGIEDLLIDFRRLLTIAPHDLYRQLALPSGPKRRCRLCSPYLEHFQARASYYLSRVGLPVPHQVD